MCVALEFAPIDDFYRIYGLWAALLVTQMHDPILALPENSRQEDYLYCAAGKGDHFASRWILLHSYFDVRVAYSNILFLFILAI